MKKKTDGYPRWITRLRFAKRGVSSGHQFRATLDSRVHSSFFSDAEHGGMAGSKRAAEKYRRAWIIVNGAAWSGGTRARVGRTKRAA